jgi:hypothetical protein
MMKFIDRNTGEEIEVRVFNSFGWEIHKDGTVWLIENGVRRQATREEALRTRAGVRFALGESIANLAGVEPE